jgi:hypothetical protein
MKEIERRLNNPSDSYGPYFTAFWLINHISLVITVVRINIVVVIDVALHMLQHLGLDLEHLKLLLETIHFV